MKSYLVCLFAAVLSFCLPVGLFAQQAPPTIQVVSTFAFPGRTNNTFPYGINQRGVIVGDINGSKADKGLIRYPDGTFGRPLVEPNAFTGTIATGANKQGLVGGWYQGTDFEFHVFFYEQGAYTEFDIDRALDTTVKGLNDTGDFVGEYYPEDQGPTQGFVSTGGNIVLFFVPGSTLTLPGGINNAGEISGFLL